MNSPTGQTVARRADEHAVSMLAAESWPRGDHARGVTDTQCAAGRAPTRPAASGAYRPIVEQYADDAASLWVLRSGAVEQPHYRPADIAALDARIDSNLDGLMASPAPGWNACEAAMERYAEPGELFTATTIALRSQDAAKLQRVIECGLSSDNPFPGLVSALGWLPGPLAHPWIERFLASKDLNHKYLAIAACSARRENPGEYLTRLLQREDCRAHPKLYARALRLAGEIKRVDLRDVVQRAMHAEEAGVKFWAAWTAALLGDALAVEALQTYATADDARLRTRALSVTLRTLPLERARAAISALADDPAHRRTAVQATGWLGDPHAVPWLIGKMADPATARLAGEAFTLITGIDLARHELNTDDPRERDAVLDDEFADSAAALYDIHLPWPDADKLAAHWQIQRARFAPGHRYFLGQPVAAAALIDTLKHGYQRQRTAAAYELALREPSRPLVNTRARPGKPS